MIKKFLKINNLGVFKDFEWDENVIESQGKPLVLQDINILFGRNYSGKTTLSRIVRSFEIGHGLEKYKEGTFKVEMKDGSLLGKDSISEFPHPVRVFNEDFVRDNLLFINSPEEGIAPFAVLGGENVEIEQEIQKLKGQLGSYDEGNETGLYLDKLNATKDYDKAQEDYRKEQEKLDTQLKNEATSSKNSIKNQNHIFGDINYDIRKLKKELNEVSSDSVLSAEQVDELKATLKEEVRTIPHLVEVAFPSFADINARAKSIVEQQILSSDKIEELVHNAMAHKWVEEGCKLHEGRETCYFCGGEITVSRWQTLERHYDEATKKLNTNIEQAIKEIHERIQMIDKLYELLPRDYYPCFKAEVEAINKDMDVLRKHSISALRAILEQLKSKQDNIHTPITYTDHSFDFTAIEAIYQRIKELNDRAIQYGKSLSEMQSGNRKKLRLNEVARFKEEIGYDNALSTIAEKDRIVAEHKTLKMQKEAEIRKLEADIKAKERLRQNEEEGARRVNEILQNYFGHRFIELRAVKQEDGDGIYFDVFRQDKKAYHLSEGERNLVAFAYFVARLNDVETATEKPIIWIDDPISSLDSNHIFFLFSLIDQHVVAKEQWIQLFISTHNLDFLRYLKRLHTSKQRAWFLIERQGDQSCLRSMPKYMKEHVTEFNYLFHQIYKCSKADEGENHELFYNFGNNARKFLEAYLYYKYPDNEKACIHKKMKRFFSDGCAATTIDRIDNELSHLEGLIERGMSISDHAEIKKCAQYILKTIEIKDPDQYNAFLESIGVANKN